MQYKITSIEHAPVDGMAAIRVESNDGSQKITFTAPINMLVGAIVELNTIYDIRASNLGALVPVSMSENFEGLDKIFPKVRVYYSGELKQYVAMSKDGDSGNNVSGVGPSVSSAIAKLANAHGFKSKMLQGGQLTLAQWFEDFNYGFENISQDLLRAELDGILSPNKGAW